MNIKKLNTNVVKCLPYQEPIKEKALIGKWWFWMERNGLNKYKSNYNLERGK
tara:strand:- start:44 stop:199 length:156 start_codon:yes stop_codon:yes gene_type:complete